MAGATRQNRTYGSEGGEAKASDTLWNFATLTAGRGVDFHPLPFDLVKEMHEPESKQFFLSNGNPIALLRW